MSRNSQAKKARRRKRQATRGHAAPRPAVPGEHAEIARTVAEVNAWLVDRGWLLDDDNSDDDLLTWVYPPSAAAVDGEREPVTRIWITLAEDDDEVVLEFGAALVGADAGDDSYLIDPGRLPDQIGSLETYRIGSPRPEFD